jgi:hypothetical protein
MPEDGKKLVGWHMAGTNHSTLGDLVAKLCYLKIGDETNYWVCLYFKCMLFICDYVAARVVKILYNNLLYYDRTVGRRSGEQFIYGTPQLDWHIGPISCICALNTTHCSKRRDAKYPIFLLFFFHSDIA